MPREQLWLPNPPDGTQVCGGFDGSLNDDWTAIKLETREGFLFTPRYGPDKRPTIWNPAEWPNHEIPRHEVHEAWSEIGRRYKLLRAYCDPGFRDETDWSHEIETLWPNLLKVGEDVFVPWVMAGNRRRNAVYEMLRRFEADLTTGLITQDGCPITTTHMGNARKIPHQDIYTLGKPSQHQKIDAGVTSALCHEAASDQRAAGWKAARKNSRIVVSGV
jgi:phage terminase large subunit-like protein